MERAGEGEGVGEELEGVAEVDDVDGLAGVELALQVFRLEAGRDQALEHHAATDDADEEESDDAKDEQRSGEAASPVEKAGIALEGVAEESAEGEQSGNPGGCADAVKEQEAQEAHAIFACNGRGECGQAGHEFCNHEGDLATAAKGILGAADTDGWFEGHFAEQAQDMMAVVATDQEPGAIGNKAGGQSGRQSEWIVKLLLSGQRACGQENWRGGERDT